MAHVEQSVNEIRVSLGGSWNSCKRNVKMGIAEVYFEERAKVLDEVLKTYFCTQLSQKKKWRYCPGW